MFDTLKVCTTEIPASFTGIKPIESLYAELNLHNVKVLITCFYSPHKTEIGNYLAQLNIFLVEHSTKYEKVLILGDFNIEIFDAKMQTFCEVYNFNSLMKQPSCLKHSDKPLCIDLILTNIPDMFPSTCVIETGLSDFYLMTLTFMRKVFQKV